MYLHRYYKQGFKQITCTFIVSQSTFIFHWNDADAKINEAAWALDHDRNAVYV